jgi:hypothetical protein
MRRFFLTGAAAGAALSLEMVAGGGDGTEAAGIDRADQDRDTAAPAAADLPSPFARPALIWRGAFIGVASQLGSRPICARHLCDGPPCGADPALLPDRAAAEAAPFAGVVAGGRLRRGSLKRFDGSRQSGTAAGHYDDAAAPTVNFSSYLASISRHDGHNQILNAVSQKQDSLLGGALLLQSRR